MQKTAELTERWRKQIQIVALSSLTERLRVQEKK
jgi:carboxyl-terminal processing protease